MSDVAVVFAAALVTALATGLGALPFVFRRRPGRSQLATANALAAGFMVGAGIGLVVEGLRTGVVRTLAGIAVGLGRDGTDRPRSPPTTTERRTSAPCAGPTPPAR